MRDVKTAGLELESALWAQGRRHIIGIDEAGRGAWAGPVVAGAICLPPMAEVRALLAGLRDSKQMTAGARSRLFERIQAVALSWGVGSASAAEIDALGIVPATCLAMRRALDALAAAFPAFTPDYLLADSIRCAPGALCADDSLPFRAVVRGDRLSLSIAAASVLAKVTRDRWIIAQAGDYPEYGFAVHKGYGVPAHRRALAAHGASPLHRRTFAPVRARIAETAQP